MNGTGIAPASRLVVVTGAGGFIGSHLVPALAAAGHRVRAVSRPASGASPGASFDASFDASSGAAPDAAVRRMAHPGIGRDADWAPVLAGADAVVHLAGLAHAPVGGRDMRRRLREVNVLATARLAEAAARAGVRDFVFMSSIKAVADRSGATPLAEQDAPAPQDCYGVAKLAGERRLWRLQRQSTSMRLIVLRPPLVYGAGVRANFAALARIAACGLPLPLAAVRNRRSLLYVGNLASAVLRCLERVDVPSGTFHLGDAAPVSTPELLRALAQARGASARLFAVPPPLLEAAARLLGRQAQASRLLGSLEADPRRFSEAFDWHPPFTLAQGLAATDLRARGGREP